MPNRTNVLVLGRSLGRRANSYPALEGI
jgi:hypothetical protein